MSLFKCESYMTTQPQKLTEILLRAFTFSLARIGILEKRVQSTKLVTQARDTVISHQVLSNFIWKATNHLDH